MSLARRLISAGLPAPSQTTTSYSVAEPGQRLQRDRLEVLLQVRVRERVDVRQRPALHHDLAAAVAARLEQDGVHVGRRLDAAGGGLGGLRPADLGAVGGDVGVERHVLRLERRDPHALAGQPPADPGGDDALARRRRWSRRPAARPSSPRLASDRQGRRRPGHAPWPASPPGEMSAFVGRGAVAQLGAVFQAAAVVVDAAQSHVEGSGRKRPRTDRNWDWGGGSRTERSLGEWAGSDRNTAR